jgi:MFS family permease
VVGAARANRRAGICLVVACAFFAASAFPPALPASIILVAAVVALTGGELFSSAGQWGMSYALAPDARQAEFIGGFTLVSSAVGVAGPYLATLIVDRGIPGWAIAAAVFLAAGLLAPVIARPRGEAQPASPAAL